MRFFSASSVWRRGPALAVLLALALPLAACATTPVETFEAAPASLRGAAYVHSVELSLAAAPRAAIAASDGRLHGEGDAGLPFARLFDEAVKEAAQAGGLTGSRALTVTVEMDELRIPDAARALIGKSDRLAGQVRVSDARTGDRLALFYVTVDKQHSGLIGLAIRGGGVREKLVREFARRIAEQLAAHARRGNPRSSAPPRARTG
jgi:type IV pilus biogenesis protein CpaD/CtpE